MRHIQFVTKRSIHCLNVPGLFSHDRGAQRLRLWRIHLKMLPRGARYSLGYAFLSESDHVTKSPLVVGWRIFEVAPALSVRERVRGFGWADGFAARTLRGLF